MKNIDLLKFLRAQLIHIENHLMAIDQASSNGKETTYTYPLASNTGALVLIDLAIQEDVVSKLEKENRELIDLLDKACGYVDDAVLYKKIEDKLETP